MLNFNPVHYGILPARQTAISMIIDLSIAMALMMLEHHSMQQYGAI